MIEKNRIMDKLREGTFYCKELSETLPSHKVEFLQNPLYVHAGERYFEIISQIILDTCTYITSNLPVTTPLNYAECIDILGEANIIPQKEQNKFRNIIKMRNLIAHRYGKVDNNLLFLGLQSICDDFNQYADLIHSWMENL